MPSPVGQHRIDRALTYPPDPMQKYSGTWDHEGVAEIRTEHPAGGGGLGLSWNREDGDDGEDGEDGEDGMGCHREERSAKGAEFQAPV
jgi:hypothetical protein